ncbi:hypothetical protein ACJZ2D_015507 [Fusarium nematophilum]
MFHVNSDGINQSAAPAAAVGSSERDNGDILGLDEGPPHEAAGRPFRRGNVPQRRHLGLDPARLEPGGRLPDALQPGRRRPDVYLQPLPQPLLPVHHANRGADERRAPRRGSHLLARRAAARTQLPHTVGGLAALGRHCPGGKPNDFTAWAAACDWYEELASDPALEEGPAEPVRRCIKISFSAPADLGSSEFLRDGFEAVVEPLEEFIDQWSGGTAGT